MSEFEQYIISFLIAVVILVVFVPLLTALAKGYRDLFGDD